MNNSPRLKKAKRQQIKQAANELFIRIGLQATLRLLAQREFSMLASLATIDFDPRILRNAQDELCKVGVDKKLIAEEDDLRLMVQEITHLAFRDYRKARL